MPQPLIFLRLFTVDYPLKTGAEIGDLVSRFAVGIGTKDADVVFFFYPAGFFIEHTGAGGENDGIHIFCRKQFVLHFKCHFVFGEI